MAQSLDPASVNHGLKRLRGQVSTGRTFSMDGIRAPSSVPTSGDYATHSWSLSLHCKACGLALHEFEDRPGPCAYQSMPRDFSEKALVHTLRQVKGLIQRELRNHAPVLSVNTREYRDRLIGKIMEDRKRIERDLDQRAFTPADYYGDVPPCSCVDCREKRLEREAGWQKAYSKGQRWLPIARVPVLTFLCQGGCGETIQHGSAEHYTTHGLDLCPSCFFKEDPGEKRNVIETDPHLFSAGCSCEMCRDRRAYYGEPPTRRVNTSAVAQMDGIWTGCPCDDCRKRRSGELPPIQTLGLSEGQMREHVALAYAREREILREQRFVTNATERPITVAVKGGVAMLQPGQSLDYGTDPLVMLAGAKLG